MLETNEINQADERNSLDRLKLGGKQILIFAASLWLIFLADKILPMDFNRWGVIPREWNGLWGIACSPFLHANLGHLVSNTVPLVILLALLLSTQDRGWEIVVGIILLGGLLLWIFGRSAVHVGASSLIYGIIAFLIVAGFRQKRIVPAVVAALVGFLYGGTLITGILPISVGVNVSWDGHLFGALAGVLLAFGRGNRVLE